MEVWYSLSDRVCWVYKPSTREVFDNHQFSSNDTKTDIEKHVNALCQKYGLKTIQISNL